MAQSQIEFLELCNAKFIHTQATVAGYCLFFFYSIFDRILFPAKLIHRLFWKCSKLNIYGCLNRDIFSFGWKWISNILPDFVRQLINCSVHGCILTCPTALLSLLSSIYLGRPLYYFYHYSKFFFLCGLSLHHRAKKRTVNRFHFLAFKQAYKSILRNLRLTPP